MKQIILVWSILSLLGCSRTTPAPNGDTRSADRTAWEFRKHYDPNCPALDECYWYPDYKTKTRQTPELSKWQTGIQWESYQKNKWPIFQNAVHVELEETDDDGTELVIKVTDIQGRRASFWVKNGCLGGIKRDNTCGGDVRDISPY